MILVKAIVYSLNDWQPSSTKHIIMGVLAESITAPNSNHFLIFGQSDTITSMLKVVEKEWKLDNSHLKEVKNELDHYFSKPTKPKINIVHRFVIGDNLMTLIYNRSNNLIFATSYHFKNRTNRKKSKSWELFDPKPLIEEIEIDKVIPKLMFLRISKGPEIEDFIFNLNLALTGRPN